MSVRFATLEALVISESKQVRPAAKLRGVIELPGDKSISHRAAMLLAVSHGTARITNFGNGDDCAATLSCLKRLGVAIENDGTCVSIEGRGFDGLKAPLLPLDCGNSGTTMRLLTGLLAGCGFKSELTGDESLRSRPMKRVIDPLRLMGAEVSSADGFAPIKIGKGNQLKAFKYELPVASAQVKSCILFAGLNADGPVTIIGTPTRERLSASRDHSELLLDFLGADISEEFEFKEEFFRQIVTLNPEQTLRAKDVDIPGDVSAASFYLVAAAGLVESEVVLRNVGLNPTRTSILELLRETGLNIFIENRAERANEPRGDIRISNSGKRFVKSKLRISGSKVAGLIDEIPILAVLGTLLPGGIEVRDAGELRLKECDRIAAIVSNLQRMGSSAVEFEDGFEVPKSRLKGAEIDSQGDHRIAMAFSIAGLIAEGPSEIRDSECVSVSYPDFYRDLGQLIRYE